MNRYRLSKAGINANEGIHRFGGKTEVYEDFLIKFITDTHYQRMCEAFSNGDVNAAFTEAHSIKGLVGNLSMNVLYEDIKPMVEALRNGDLNKAEQMLPNVEKDYNEVVSALREQYN